MNILVLDDDVRRHSWFARALCGNRVVHVYDYHRACGNLDKVAFDVVYLDHDLNDFGRRSIVSSMYGIDMELTGLDVADFITKLPAEKRPKKVIIHSWNPYGALQMRNVLQAASVPVTYEPFQVPEEVALELLDEFKRLNEGAEDE